MLGSGLLFAIERAPNDLPWQVAGHATVFVNYSAVHDRIVQTRRFLDHPLACGRIVIRPFGLMGADGFGIEDCQIGSIARPQQATSLQTENRSEVKSQFVDRLL